MAEDTAKIVRYKHLTHQKGILVCGAGALEQLSAKVLHDFERYSNPPSGGRFCFATLPSVVHLPDVKVLL